MLMQKMKSILIVALWLASGNILAQAGQQHVDAKETAGLDAEREKHAPSSPRKRSYLWPMLCPPTNMDSRQRMGNSTACEPLVKW